MCRMTDFAAIAAASFVYVFAKSFQQSNVSCMWYLPVLPTSFVLAAMEVTVVVKICRADSMWTAIPLGFGAGLGCMAAMWSHQRMRNRN